MDLALSDSERMLQESVRGFVRREATRPALVDLDERGLTWPVEWLRTFAEAGWLGVFVPDELGGSGASTLESAIVFEELGRGPVPGPFLASSVVGALVLGGLDGPAGPDSRGVRDRLRAGIADGSAVVIPALRDPESSWRGVAASTAELSNVPDAPGSAVLDAVKVFVPYADAATHFVVSVRSAEPGAARFAVVPADADGVEIRDLGGFLHATAEVRFTGVAVPADHVLTAASADALDLALAPGLVAVAAYQAGGCAALLDMCLDHANERVQFGVPVGRFQRVQDHVIRILNATDSARWITYEAAWTIDSGQSGAANAHMALAVAGDSYWEAADAAHEVHAGIGSDPKFGMTLYTRAARTVHDFLGSPEWHKARMADRLAWSV